MPHKNARTDLTAEYVRSILDYEPETGIFRWKVSLARRNKIGDIAGSIDQNGYRKMGIHNREYYAHRLAWLIMRSEWPPKEIDHLHGDPSDNRWEKLRTATSSQNITNRSAKAGRSGYRGVSWAVTSNKWMAKITVNRRQKYLGIFNTPEEAHEAYRKAAAELHGNFAKHN
jgi:hypothetical protein